MAEDLDGSGPEAGSTSAFVSRLLEGAGDEEGGATTRVPERGGAEAAATADESTDGPGVATGDDARPAGIPGEAGSETGAAGPTEDGQQTITVTVDGEERGVGLDALRAGYRRLAALSQAQQAPQGPSGGETQGAEMLSGLREQLARQAGIKTPEEIQKLHDEGNYSDWVVAREQRRAFDERFETQLATSRQAMAAAQLQAVNDCWQKVPELLPEWRDLERAGEEIRAVGGYLVEQGVPAGQVALITNPLVWPIARKAMLYDRLQASKAAVTKRVAEAPRMQAAGAARSPKAEESERYAADRQRLRTSGKVEDAARLFRRII